MTYTRHICNMEEYGVVATATANPNPTPNGNAAAIAAIYANASKGDTLILPPGYTMISSVIPALPSYVQLVGCGPQSNLVRGFSQGEGDIFVRMGAQDSAVRNLTIFTAEGCTGGWAVGREAQNVTDSVDHLVIDNVETSRFQTGTWYGAAKLCAVKGAPNYGARRLMVNDLICGSCTYVGLWLGAVNDVSVKGIVLGAGNPFPTWGLWCVGVENNPCNLIKAEGPMNNSILLYRTNASMFTGACMAKVLIDIYSASNQFICGFLSEPPTLQGINNHLMSGGVMYSSDTSETS